MYEQLTKKIFKLMGIKRDYAARAEAGYIAKWKEEYKFKDDVIIEATRRAANMNKATFMYVDGILTNWHTRGVTNYTDILALDDEFKKKNGKTVEIDKYRKILKVKYHSDKIEKLKFIDGKSDWVDLRAAEDVTLEQGDFYMIDLGISVQIPEGYEMIIAPRSSTYKNFGIIQANSIGIIDESYCGNDDVLKMPVIAMRHTEIHLNNRICQFRIIKHQPALTFEEVDDLGNRSRGGFGSTGRS